MLKSLLSVASIQRKEMDPKTEKLVRRTTMIATLTAAYFLLTEDYGQNPNALDPATLYFMVVMATRHDYIMDTYTCESNKKIITNKEIHHPRVLAVIKDSACENFNASTSE
ncbi:hypothetical protein ACLOJK_022605 [Asimina triloba]